jgi:phage shock protein A
MATDLHERLQRVARKAQGLTDRYDVLEREKKAADAHIAELEATVAELRKRVEELDRQVEYLTVVTTAIPSRDDVERSRSVISKLVREIDKCIADLSD